MTVKNQVLIWDGVSIADEVFVGPGVIFTNDRHPRSGRMPAVAPRYADPAAGAWERESIAREPGGRPVILPGVTIGRYAMVAPAPW